MKTRSKKNNYRIGEVYYMKFEGEGSEQDGWRPGLVFQNNVGNAHSPNIIALSITSAQKKLFQPTHVFVRADDSGMKLDSVVQCENPERMSKARIGGYITTLSEKYMKQIAAASLLATSVISYLDMESVISVWKKAVRLNGDGAIPA